MKKLVLLSLILIVLILSGCVTTGDYQQYDTFQINVPAT